MVFKAKDLLGMGVGVATNEIWTKYVTEHTESFKDLINGLTAVGALFAAYQISESGYNYNFLEDFLVGFGLAEVKELTGTLIQ